MGNKQNQNENNNIENKFVEDLDKKHETEEIEKPKKAIYKYNILFVGESKIGTKTSLIKRIIEGKFIQVDRYTKIEKHKYLIYEKEDKNIILYLIDINSDNDNNKSFKDYFKNADCIIMGYDVTNKKSLQKIIDYWYAQSKELSKADLIYLLGNKIDLQGNIKSREKEGKIFADINNIKFFPISIKNNINVEEFLNDLRANLENNNHNNINNGIKEIIYGNPSKISYKVTLIGDSGIGSKTSFINVVVKNIFIENVPSTNGASYNSKIIPLNNGEIIIEFWDTAGQERYKSLTKFFLKDADCIIFGYDVTKRTSFDSIKTFWYDYALDVSSTNLFYLLGNKIDLINEREVSKIVAYNYCKEKNIRYFEISCLTSTGIKEFLDDLTNELIKR